MSAMDRLAEIEARDLNLCGPCDVGLPMGCTCGDPRASLMATVTALKAVLTACEKESWMAGEYDTRVLDVDSVLDAITEALT